MYSRGFSCILEGDMQKIIANFQQQFGLSANLKDFCKLARTSDVSTFHLISLQSKISDINSFVIQAYLCERLFHTMDKKRDNMVTLDEFKEFFNKLSTSDFASFTEFLFQIFDSNGNSTKFIILEVSCFSDQNSVLNVSWIFV